MTGRREQFIVEGIPANLGGQHSIQLSGVLESVPESSSVSQCCAFCIPSIPEMGAKCIPCNPLFKWELLLPHLL